MISWSIVNWLSLVAVWSRSSTTDWLRQGQPPQSPCLYLPPQGYIYIYIHIDTVLLLLRKSAGATDCGTNNCWSTVHVVCCKVLILRYVYTKRVESWGRYITREPRIIALSMSRCMAYGKVFSIDSKWGRTRTFDSKDSVSIGSAGKSFTTFPSNVKHVISIRKLSLSWIRWKGLLQLF